MRNTTTLLPILRSRVQGDLLALTYLNPEAEYSITELARRIDASVKTVHHEASRLVEAGILADRKVGTSRLVRAVPESLLTRPLTDLLAVTHGPLPVLTEALAGAPGVLRAFIYGSWAARYEGTPGPVPGDIDVLVVGDADIDALYARAHSVERVLRREVNVRRVRQHDWDEGSDLFVTTVRSRPLVELRVARDKGIPNAMEPGAQPDRHDAG